MPNTGNDTPDVRSQRPPLGGIERHDEAEANDAAPDPTHGWAKVVLQMGIPAAIACALTFWIAAKLDGKVDALVTLQASEAKAAATHYIGTMELEKHIMWYLETICLNAAHDTNEARRCQQETR